MFNEWLWFLSFSNVSPVGLFCVPMHYSDVKKYTNYVSTMCRWREGRRAER